MARRGNLPNINQHRDEEEEEGNEAGSTPGPRDGASQGQGAAGEAVDVDSSGTGLGHGFVPGTTLGDSIVQPGRRVTFSLGVSTPAGRGGQTTGHMPPGRGARAPQGRGRGFDPTRGNAQEGSTYHAFPSRNSNHFPAQPAVRAPNGREKFHMNTRREGRGDTTSPI